MTDAPVTRVLLADHQLPEEFRTGHVEVRRITLAPGLVAGPHVHNGPVFGVVTAGSVDFRVGDGPVVRLRAGDVFYEPGDQRIAGFDATDEGAEFLGWFLLPTGVAGMLTPLT